MSQLNGKKIAFLATDGVEESELTQPWQAMRDAGAKVELISLENGSIQCFQHHEKGEQFPVDLSIEHANASDYNGLVLPGGVFNPDALRGNEKAVQFVRAFFDQHKPVAAICHGPVMLAEADVLRGRTITRFPIFKPISSMPERNGLMRNVFVMRGWSPVALPTIGRVLRQSH